jgi:hypothetical protein
MVQVLDIDESGILVAGICYSGWLAGNFHPSYNHLSSSLLFTLQPEQLNSAGQAYNGEIYRQLLGVWHVFAAEAATKMQ